MCLGRSRRGPPGRLGPLTRNASRLRTFGPSGCDAFCGRQALSARGSMPRGANLDFDAECGGVLPGPQFGACTGTSGGQTADTPRRRVERRRPAFALPLKGIFFTTSCTAAVSAGSSGEGFELGRHCAICRGSIGLTSTRAPPLQPLATIRSFLQGFRPLLKLSRLCNLVAAAEIFLKPQSSHVRTTFSRSSAAGSSQRFDVDVRSTEEVRSSEEANAERGDSGGFAWPFM
mmetsp:Transcript_72893/g.171009  ORF Transcript_72893/g.171009 Transcript_72893/m.171009 type:complete len:231 (-) Transcript_72893:30-722(-)